MSTIQINGKSVELEEWEIVDDYYDEDKEHGLESTSYLSSDLEYQEKEDFLETQKIRRIEHKLRRHIRRVKKQEEENE